MRSRALGVDAEAVEQLGVERGVAQADPVRLEARRIEGGAQDGQDLRRPLRRGHPDQLDPGLKELAGLPALGANAPVGVREVAEAKRRLGVAVAGGDHARDRDRHVRP